MHLHIIIIFSENGQISSSLEKDNVLVFLLKMANHECKLGLRVVT